MWNTAEAPVPIFEDEDEQALISEFVRLSALFPKRNAFEICEYIFKDLRDPVLRANQAAMQWPKSLEILDRIDKAKLNGGVEPKPIDSKEEKLRKLEAIYNNEDNSLRERIKAMELHAQIQGEIIKAVDKQVSKVSKVNRQVIFALSPNAA